MAIAIRDLAKSYDGSPVLDIDRLDVPRGQIVGVVGNNGVGKTTLLRCLLDLVRLDRGSVCLDGSSVAATSDWKRKTGAYLDAAFLIGYMRAHEYLHLVGRAYGLPYAVVIERIEAMEAFLSGIGRKNAFIRDHSTGTQDKIGIAAALLPNPSFLVLDEPFAHLDPGSRLWLKRRILSLRANHGATCVVSSHDLSGVLDVCDRIVLLRAGRIAEDAAAVTFTPKTLEERFDSADLFPSTARPRANS